MKRFLFGKSYSHFEAAALIFTAHVMAHGDWAIGMGMLAVAFAIQAIVTFKDVSQ